MPASLKCRVARESEIAFLVDAFKLTLIEILNKKTRDIDILPSQRTLDNLHSLIKESYSRGYVSYIVETCEEEMIGYMVFIANNLAFDLNKNVCTLMTLYIEPEYRNKGVGKFMINSVEPFLKKIGVNIIITAVEKYTPRLFKRWKFRNSKNLEIVLA